MNKGAIMQEANSRGLLVNGFRVQISGSRNDFATATISDREHPFYGWHEEYSWQAIQRAAEGNGMLVA